MQRTVILFALFAGAALALGALPAAHGDDPEPRAVAVTVYNGNLGLVRDERRIELEDGVFTLPFRDVAALIDPTSVAFRALRAGGAVDVLEQNYEYDLMTPEALLEKYVGETVTLVTTTADGEDRAVRAKLLSVQGGTVYQIGDSIALNPPGRVVLPALVGDLTASPTLVWTLASQRAGLEPVEVSYLTGGLSWKADYVATLSADDRSLELGGWVTIDNRSGTTYPDAKLKLVAGDIHRAPQAGREEFARHALEVADAAPSAAAFEERTFFEYHLYDLPRPTTIKNNQTKQIRLLETASVRTQKVFRLAGAPWYYTQQYGGEQGLKVGVYQEFENRERDGLGVPLPAGTVRLYKADADGTLQLVGEDRIDHTPEGEKVVLKIGEAFDVVADRRQTEFEVVASGHVWEEAFEVVIRNHKKEDIVVQVVEPLPGEWRMLSNSHDFEKLDAFTVRFDVPVKAGGEATLQYRIRIEY